MWYLAIFWHLKSSLFYLFIYFPICYLNVFRAFATRILFSANCNKRVRCFFRFELLRYFYGTYLCTWLENWHLGFLSALL